MPKFHINPKTGAVSECRARVKCRFGEETKHFSDKESALKNFEKLNSPEKIPQSLKKVIPNQKFKFDKNLPEIDPEEYVRNLSEESDNFEYEIPGSGGFKILGEYSRADARLSKLRLHDFWLQDEKGNNIAFLHTILDFEREDWCGNKPVLKMCDIEVKEDERGKGYGRGIREIAEKLTGCEIYSSGGFTPKGFEAFGKHSKFYPWIDTNSEYGEKSGIKFRDMDFVRDWKNRLPENGSYGMDYGDRYYDSLLSEER